jgi:predicted DNA-binding protein (MmcQ/YjbR family)
MFAISVFLSEVSSANIYMNKANWNSIILDGSILKGEIERMMDNSFKLVVSKMTKKDQQSLIIHR